MKNPKKISKACLSCHLVSLCLERGREMLVRSFGTCARCGATFFGRYDELTLSMGDIPSYAWDTEYGFHTIRLPPCGIGEKERTYLSASICPSCNKEVRDWEEDNDTGWDWRV